MYGKRKNFRLHCGGIAVGRCDDDDMSRIGCEDLSEGDVGTTFDSFSSYPEITSDNLQPASPYFARSFCFPPTPRLSTNQYLPAPSSPEIYTTPPGYKRSNRPSANSTAVSSPLSSAASTEALLELEDELDIKTPDEEEAQVISQCPGDTNNFFADIRRLRPRRAAKPALAAPTPRSTASLSASSSSTSPSFQLNGQQPLTPPATPESERNKLDLFSDNKGITAARLADLKYITPSPRSLPDSPASSTDDSNDLIIVKRTPAQTSSLRLQQLIASSSPRNDSSNRDYAQLSHLDYLNRSHDTRHKASRTTTVSSPTTNRKAHTELDNDTDTESETETRCACANRSTSERGFEIACDGCDEWYHSICSNVAAKDQGRIDRYFCADCTKNGVGVTTWKTESTAGDVRGDEIRLRGRVVKLLPAFEPERTELRAAKRGKRAAGKGNTTASNSSSFFPVAQRGTRNQGSKQKTKAKPRKTYQESYEAVRALFIGSSAIGRQEVELMRRRDARLAAQGGLSIEHWRYGHSLPR